MISFDLAVYKPETAEEAVSAFLEAKERGEDPRYYSGGTEVVTTARDGKLRTGALIDLKGVDGGSAVEERGGELRFGANVSLTRLAEGDFWPLLAKAAGAVGDRSVRNSITLGGNICGSLPYREAVLPFLLTESVAELHGPQGFREQPLTELFDKRLKLGAGEFLLALRVPVAEVQLPSFYRRREKDSRVDYPIATLCALRGAEGIRLATAGAFTAPRRLVEAEAVLASGGDGAADGAERAAAAVAAIPARCKSDYRASAEYRRGMLELAVAEALAALTN